MITKENMLEVIYNKIADKTLSFGCKVKLTKKYSHNYFELDIGDELIVVHIDSKYEHLFKAELIRGVLTTPYSFKNDLEIIGHPFLIGDVLDWIKKTREKLFEGNTEEYIYSNCYRIISKWEEKRKPIESQNIDCIEYIYNLIKDDETSS